MAKARNLSTLLAADGQVEDAKIDGVAASKLTGTIPDARLSADAQVAKLPLAGGAMTGAITTNSTFDGVDIATVIAANTAKTGITSSQASAITANTAKTGITSGQASAITANTAKVTNSTSASDLTSGTLPDARFPSTLPALNGSALTNIPSDVTVASTAPSSPAQGDLWFDSTSSVKALNVWSGTAWNQLSNKFTATGGTITAFGSYTIHAFTSSGTFVAEAAGNVDILVVAGGGGSNTGRINGAWDGGGGAGGLRYLTSQAATAQSYTITIGGGGGYGANGANSSALGITSLGGGYGGVSTTGNGASGGSGGGGGGDQPTSGGAGTSGQGFAGGPGTDPGGNPYYEQGGGGGGAGEAGNTDGLGHGGDGADMSSYFGTTYGESGWFSGGGGGGAGTSGTSDTNPGGQGGGGDSGGGYTGSTAASNGTANTGGGGGGGAHSRTGGSGIVLIRYLT